MQIKNKVTLQMVKELQEKMEESAENIVGMAVFTFYAAKMGEGTDTERNLSTGD